MANVNVTSDAWTEISITSGTVQNISATADIELSAEQTDNSGVVLKPSELYQWDNETIYARAVTEETGALRVVNFKRAAGGGGYVLPVASTSTLGGVKVGNNLSIDASGVLSANAGGYTLPPATASTLGGVIIGDNVTVDANGEISVAAPYSLPTATANDLGGVKIGSGLSIDGDGVLASTGGGNPVGTIISFMGTSAPPNYLICDGTAYNITDYQTLADHIAAQFGSVAYFGGDGITTFAIPDLRGEFLRGTGTNNHANQGNGANVGVHQDATTFPNFTTWSSNIYKLRAQGEEASSATEVDFDIGTRNDALKVVASIESGASTQRVAYTSRPTNTSVLYCIKYQ